jgi:c-di-GMP-related signal transduction protein
MEEEIQSYFFFCGTKQAGIYHILNNIYKLERIEFLSLHYHSQAHALNLKVVAERVERKEEYKYLVDSSCDCMQGYFIFNSA